MASNNDPAVRGDADPIGFDAVAVYDGQTFLGSMAEREGRWHAADADNRPLGIFETRQIARTAIIASRSRADQIGD